MRNRPPVRTRPVGFSQIGADPIAVGWIAVLLAVPALGLFLSICAAPLVILLDLSGLSLDNSDSTDDSLGIYAVLFILMLAASPMLSWAGLLIGLPLTWLAFVRGWAGWLVCVGYFTLSGSALLSYGGFFDMAQTAVRRQMI